MQSDRNTFLIIGASCSALAALAHLACIVIGGDAYRFLGAGEQMAQMAEQGHWYPSVSTLFISTLLIFWSLYALAGAGVIRRLPLLRIGLVVISAIYLVRGVAFVVIMPLFPGNSLTFWLVSSGICFSIGVLYAIGTVQVWPRLSKRQ